MAADGLHVHTWNRFCDAAAGLGGAEWPAPPPPREAAPRSGAGVGVGVGGLAVAAAAAGAGGADGAAYDAAVLRAPHTRAGLELALHAAASVLAPGGEPGCTQRPARVARPRPQFGPNLPRCGCAKSPFSPLCEAQAETYGCAAAAVRASRRLAGKKYFL